MASRLQCADLDFNSVSKILNLPDPTVAQHPATKNYVDAIVAGLAWKDDVKAAGASNINLASPGTTIDGVTMSSGDRFLARSQTTNTENGVYIWNGSATPATRSADMTSSANFNMAVVTVDQGTDAGTTWRQTAVNPTVGTTAIAFTAFGTAASAASTSTAGVAKLATQTQVDTGSDNTTIVTPATLSSWANRARQVTGTLGDGSATSYTLTHNFNTRNVVVQVWRNSGNYDQIEAEVRRNNVNSVDVLFSAAPSSAQFAYSISTGGTI
jgi:hypothetical protein